jgi:hypothetical protein
MVLIVVVINIVISLILLSIAWRVWLLKRKLAQITNTLIVAERNTYAALNGAPKGLYIGQQSIHNLRQGNQSLELQVQQLRKIANLLVVVQQFWWRRKPKIRLKSRK